jgi:hypothetical protein
MEYPREIGQASTKRESPEHKGQSIKNRKGNNLQNRRERGFKTEETGVSRTEGAGSPKEKRPSSRTSKAEPLEQVGQSL